MEVPQELFTGGHPLLCFSTIVGIKKNKNAQTSQPRRSVAYGFNWTIADYFVISAKISFAKPHPASPLSRLPSELTVMSSPNSCSRQSRAKQTAVS